MSAPAFSVKGIKKYLLVKAPDDLLATAIEDEPRAVKVIECFFGPVHQWQRPL